MSGHLEIYNGPYTHAESRHVGPMVISMIPLRTFSDIQLDHVNTQKVDTSARYWMPWHLTEQPEIYNQIMCTTEKIATTRYGLVHCIISHHTYIYSIYISTDISKYISAYISLYISNIHLTIHLTHYTYSHTYISPYISTYSSAYVSPFTHISTLYYVPILRWQFFEHKHSYSSLKSMLGSTRSHLSF